MVHRVIDGSIAIALAGCVAPSPRKASYRGLAAGGVFRFRGDFPKKPWTETLKYVTLSIGFWLVKLSRRPNSVIEQEVP